MQGKIWALVKKKQRAYSGYLIITALSSVSTHDMKPIHSLVILVQVMFKNSLLYALHGQCEEKKIKL